MAFELDDIDRELLNLLQENARYSAVELAEAVGVSDNTVHNRMDRLEEEGVVTGYTATVDADRAGLDLQFVFTCTARISQRSEVADRIMEIPAVLEVTELMTGEENLIVKAVAVEDEEISRIAKRVDELDVEINDENMVRERHTKPLDFFAVATGDD